MDPEIFANMLSAKGLSDEEIDNALAHFGVKGMRWGQRKAKEISNSPKTRSASDNKAVRLTAAGISGYAVARTIGSRSVNGKAILVGGAAAAFAVNRVLKNHGDKTLKELRDGASQ